MLPTLLAALLSAAPDSALAKSTQDRAADSIALEHVSPLPPPPPNRVPSPVESRKDTGPLQLNSLGVGFRALGNSSRGQLLASIDDGFTFFRLVGGFSSRHSDEERTETTIETAGPNTTNSSSRKVTLPRTASELEIALEIGRLHNCHGNLCASTTLGPLYGKTIETTGYPVSDGEYRERTVTDRLGISVTTGLRWEFHKNLALAGEIGAQASSLSGESSKYVRYESTSFPSDIQTTTGKIDGSDFGVRFLGVGLDAWF